MSTQPSVVHLWQWTFQISDLVNAGLLLLAVISLWITFYQILRGIRAQQASVFKEVYLTAFAQADMLEALSIVELGQFAATLDGGASDKIQEIKVNMLLGFAECVCNMGELKLMSKRELRKFTYFFLILFHNDAVKTYCRFLQNWEMERTGGIRLRPYSSWVDYCTHEFKVADLYAPGSGVKSSKDNKSHLGI